MPEYDDIDRDRRDDNRDDDRGPDDRPAGDRAVARQKVGLPALLLQLNAAVGVILAVLLMIPLVFQPQILIDQLKGFVASMPPGPEKQQQEEKVKQLEQQLGQGGAAGMACNAAQLLLFAALNVLVFVGAGRMKQLRSYGLALTAAIVSLIPCLTGVCCTGMPFGLWALIVLMNPDVKAGFDAVARRSAAGPE